MDQGRGYAFPRPVEKLRPGIHGRDMISAKTMFEAVLSWVEGRSSLFFATRQATGDSGVFQLAAALFFLSFGALPVALDDCIHPVVQIKNFCGDGIHYILFIHEPLGGSYAIMLSIFVLFNALSFAAPKERAKKKVLIISYPTWIFVT